MPHRRRDWENLYTALLCIAIVAVLGAIILPNFIRARAQGRTTSCKSNLKNIATALAMYRDDAGSYPSALNQLSPRYLKGIPTCPSVGRDTYSRAYEGSAAAYTVVCEGRNHEGVGLAANFPQYTSVQGLREKRPER